MDRVVSFVIQACHNTQFVSKAWLFGSRITGQATEKSDYDFAFEINAHRVLTGEWGRFCSFLREKNPSLNTLDLVRIEEISKDFREKILADGQLIYEQTRSVKT